MGRVLKNDVHVTLDGAYEATVFTAGTAATGKLAGLIPNPKAWVEVADEASLPVSETETGERGGGQAPADPAVPAALSAPYDGAKFAALQAEAKRRDLPGSGNTAELIARLEADDRDKAAGGDDTEGVAAMASVTVAIDDVQKRANFPLTSRFSEEYIETQIADAVEDADALWGAKIAERLASGRLGPNRYKRIIADAVLRVIRNPEGFTSENDGGYGYGKRADVASGSLFFTDRDVELLTGGTKARMPGTIMMRLDKRIG